MGAFEDKIRFMTGEATKLGLRVDQALLEKVAKGLGPALYNDDASLVSTSDRDELKRVKENFLMGKLGLTDEAAMDVAIEEVTNQFGASNKNKHRALFYYLLVEKFGKGGMYN
ncbi:MAG: hypothetical protein JPMHGGIA_02176 [Saprospiraceae bacterium]|jgi:hypothetical protein|nr:hypothetical protein [Saprospiraceae bacterium]